MKTPSIYGILTILITLFGIVHSQGCPSECSCYAEPIPSGKVIDCSNRGLTSIPTLAYPGGGSIARIDLSNNMLTTLDINEVYMRIRGSTVDVLDFSSNSISAFIGTVDAANGIDYTTLNMSNNAFTSFPQNVIPVTHYPNELILDFSNNRLTELSRHMFAGTNERILFGFQFLARNNMISQIDDEVFQGVQIVDTILDLRFNRLTTLSSTFIPPVGVREIRFSGNPWNCDCNLRWIINPLRFIVNYTSSDPPACITPAALKNTRIFRLTSNEFTCLPFQHGPLRRNIPKQDSFSLSCPATADPPNPEITWTVWLPCPSGARDPLELFFTSDEITLSNIDINPKAAFRCTASNNAGSVNFDLDVRVNGEMGIDIPGTSNTPSSTEPGETNPGFKTTIRPSVRNTAGRMTPTMTVGGNNGGSTTDKGSGGNDDVMSESIGRSVVGIIILVIILLISWCIIGFLVYRVLQLKKNTSAADKRSIRLDTTPNDNTSDVDPTITVQYSHVTKNNSGWNGTTIHQEPEKPVYAEPEKIKPQKPTLPNKPAPPPKPTSNPYQYNTEAEYDDPPLRFGVNNGGYDNSHNDSSI